MANLTEKTVQIRALEYLRKYYSNGFRTIFNQIEMRTKKEYGGYRADGLLVFKSMLTGTYVVSMEAKSSKTLPALKPYRDNWRWIKNSLWAGFLFCIGSGAAFFVYREELWVYRFMFPLTMLITGGLIYAILTRNSFRHKNMKVVQQIEHYPANEQWLSFSKDSFKKIKPEEQRNLKRICHFRGIGILIVGSNKKVDLVCRPKRRFWRGNFLKYYSKEKEIRTYLNS